MTEMHAVITGPIQADITLSDGRVVDCRPDWVFLESAEFALELGEAIGAHLAANGHPWHDASNPFTHNAQEG